MAGVRLECVTWIFSGQECRFRRLIRVSTSVRYRSRSLLPIFAAPVPKGFQSTFSWATTRCTLVSWWGNQTRGWNCCLCVICPIATRTRARITLIALVKQDLTGKLMGWCGSCTDSSEAAEPSRWSRSGLDREKVYWFRRGRLQRNRRKNCKSLLVCSSKPMIYKCAQESTDPGNKAWGSLCLEWRHHAACKGMAHRVNRVHD